MDKRSWNTPGGLGRPLIIKQKSLAVYMGLQIAHSRNIHNLTVLRDSELIIKDLLNQKTYAIQIPNGLHSQTKTLK
jgi:hypothetical protein